MGVVSLKLVFDWMGISDSDFLVMAAKECWALDKVDGYFLKSVMNVILFKVVRNVLDYMRYMFFQAN